MSMLANERLRLSFPQTRRLRQTPPVRRRRSEPTFQRRRRRKALLKTLRLLRKLLVHQSPSLRRRRRTPAQDLRSSQIKRDNGNSHEKALCERVLSVLYRLFEPIKKFVVFVEGFLEAQHILGDLLLNRFGPLERRAVDNLIGAAM